MEDTGGARITRAESRLIERATSGGTVRVLVSSPGPGKQQGVLKMLEKTDADVLTVYDAFPVLLVNADAPVVRALATDDRVIGLQEDVAEPPVLASSVPLINADDMRVQGFDGSGTIVAILDTGIDVDHPFFAGRIVSQSCYSNAGGAGGNVTLCPGGTSSETTGNAANAETAACISVATNLCTHGSHVAGIAAGNATGSTPGAPGDGVAPDARILAMQVFTRFNSPASCAPSAAPCVLSYTSDQLLGLQRVATLESGGTLLPNHVVSVNMSLGGGSNATACDADSRKPAIDALIALNVATVIASGNNGYLNSVGAPGCISTAVTVGATNDADAVASFSNRGGLLDLFAPGVSIDSSIPDDTYANFQGTSMATPHVAGAWAILREKFPSDTVAQILARLQSTGVPITYSNGSVNVTTPRIDVLAAGGSAGPPNDNFANATSLSGPAPTVTGDTNVGATKETGEPNHAGNVGGHSVWYSWTAPATGPVTVDTDGSNFDTTLATYTGNAVNGLTLVAQDDDSGPGTTSLVEIDATSGFTYRIAVDGYNGATGTVDLHVSQTANPSPTPENDFNGDGRSDLAWRNSATGEDYLWFMNGTQLGSSGPTLTLADQAWKVAETGDLNGDAKADLVWRNSSTGEVYVWLMNGTTVASHGSVFTLADQNWKLVGTGDFNGNGTDDLLWRNAVTGENYVWFMNGTTLASSGPTPHPVGPFLEGRGHRGLQRRLARPTSPGGTPPGQVYVWLMDGTSLVSHGAVFTLGDANWQVQGTGDYDGNGKDDLLWRNEVTGENYLWFMNGTSLASSGPIQSLADLAWKVGGTGDYDGNGKADIAWRNASTGQVYVWLMDGTSLVSHGATFTLADPNWQIVPTNPPAGALFRVASSSETGLTYTVSRRGAPKLSAAHDSGRWWHKTKAAGPRTRPPTAQEMTWTVGKG